MNARPAPSSRACLSGAVTANPRLAKDAWSGPMPNNAVRIEPPIRRTMPAFAAIVDSGLGNDSPITEHQSLPLLSAVGQGQKSKLDLHPEFQEAVRVGHQVPFASLQQRQWIRRDAVDDGLHEVRLLAFDRN